MNGKLYTFGYLAGDWERLTALLDAPMSVVLDVRFSPYSRVKGYNKYEFEKMLGGQYRWVQDLGNENYKGGPIKLKNERAGVKLVRDLLAQGYVVVLMCACADVAACHRTYIARKVDETMGGMEFSDLAKGKRVDPQQKLFG